MKYYASSFAQMHKYQQWRQLGLDLHDEEVHIPRLET